jgi:hypothetical protein
MVDLFHPSLVGQLDGGVGFVGGSASTLETLSTPNPSLIGNCPLLNRHFFWCH